VEVVGLCFSDLKLLKQFAGHARKSEIVSGIDAKALAEIPSYVPGDKPTVPGHETVIRIEAIGPSVSRFKVGERYLVQTDYRWLRTASSNAAFGYNFEGALQEYVLMDERVITSPQGESMLLPASENLSASAIALVEPWACVEDAYVSHERTSIKKDGRMLIVPGDDVPKGSFGKLFKHYGRPREITWASKRRPPTELSEGIKKAEDFGLLPDAAYDDIVYFGCNPTAVEGLFAKLGAGGILNIVLCGGRFAREVESTVGRVHYGSIRIVGTCGSDPADSMRYIPKTGEIRPGDRINIVGAGGPMGMMHVIRNICQGVDGVSVLAGDVDDSRLEMLARIAEPVAKKNNVEFRTYNPKQEKIEDEFDYTALMTPVPQLVADAVLSSAERAIINIFAGIQATVTGKLDLDMYIEKQIYFIGTSGSTLEDMKRMLAKLEAGKLDTNVSVAAISGLDGATDGIRAVENRTVAGKIMVYPACRGLGLTRLEELDRKLPEVAGCLNDGLWTPDAEKKLLESYSD
jgi:threonine dehydrogenase-like Zn-dependent dehydrogenase